MINLAPMRYATVMTETSGPIERLEFGRLDWSDGVLFQANAYLSKALNLTTRHSSVFTLADGSGTATSAMMARYMAISEALERWALYYLFQSGNWSTYGLDIDCSSTGMAAYPGALPCQARKRAQKEAVERYCLSMWADGKLPCRRLQLEKSTLHGIEIQNPLSRHHIVLLWRKEKAGFYTYGFAASRKFKKGIYLARIEMERAFLLLKSFHLENPGFKNEDLPTVSDPLERRIISFSLQQGHAAFSQLVRDTQNLPEVSHRPNPLIDRSIPGPWEKYTHVWRKLYPMPAQVYMQHEDNFFYW